MKKLIMALTGMSLVAACHSSSPSTASAPGAPPVLTGNQTGGPDANSAISGFLGAAKRQDLQAMSAYWGSEDALARDTYPRDELEKREFIMICYLKHDSFDILADAPAIGGGHEVAVNMVLGGKTRSTKITVVQAKNRRWYVKDVKLEPLQEFCASRRG